jgi:hypothetical protein
MINWILEAGSVACPVDDMMKKSDVSLLLFRGDELMEGGTMVQVR